MRRPVFMGAAEIATRFNRDVLADIQATVPLESGTATRVAEALVVLSSEQER